MEGQNDIPDSLDSGDSKESRGSAKEEGLPLQEFPIPLEAIAGDAVERSDRPPRIVQALIVDEMIQGFGDVQPLTPAKLSGDQREPMFTFTGNDMA